MPKFGEFLFGGKDKVKKEKTITPMQEELKKLISEALKGGEGPLKDLFGGFNAEEFEKGVAQPHIKQFQEEILPGILEKFAGGLSGSSAKGRAGAKAATDLQSQLAKLMYEAQQGQKQNQIQGVNQVLASKDVENIYKQGNEGAAQGFIKGLGQGAGSAAGAAIAG